MLSAVSGSMYVYVGEHERLLSYYITSLLMTPNSKQWEIPESQKSYTNLYIGNENFTSSISR